MFSHRSDEDYSILFPVMCERTGGRRKSATKWSRTVELMMSQRFMSLMNQQHWVGYGSVSLTH
jgi:hypothetical protein